MKFPHVQCVAQTPPNLDRVSVRGPCGDTQANEVCVSGAVNTQVNTPFEEMGY